MAIKVGDKVMTSARKDVNGTSLCHFVNKTVYTVIQIGGRGLDPNRVVIGLNGVVTAAVWMNTLTSMEPPTPAPPTPPLPPPTPAPVPAPPPKMEVDLDGIANNFLSEQGDSNRINKRNDATGDRLVMHVDNHDTAGNSTFSDIGNVEKEQEYSHETIDENIANIEMKAPILYQNSAKYPKIKGFDTKNKYYRYDYYTGEDFEKNLTLSMDTVRKSSNLDILNRHKLTNEYATRYNRFKLDNPNDKLTKTFAHIFFVKPDCRIYKDGTNDLIDELNINPEFLYAKQHSPFLLDQLTQHTINNDFNKDEFMYFLSNKARSFEIADEYINVDSYGSSLIGYKIPYGKDNTESKTVGKFSIKYIDDRDLHIYQLTKLWSDYISLVFRGKANPREEYLRNKVLDYPTCVYYILCAEDGETIIFWSKYWGVFPIESPSSTFSFNFETIGGISNPELNIQYQYAWKDDFDPLTLVEFNEHCTNKDYSYLPTYNNSILGSGYTWASTPYIEVVDKPTLDVPYTFKLRFRKD